MIGRKKSRFFKDIKLKVTSEITSWQHKWFSSGGKEIIIQAIAQAVPAYAMSVFRLPNELCDDIQKSIAKFGGARIKRRKESIGLNGIN